MSKNDSWEEYEEVDGIKYYPSYEAFQRTIQELIPDDSDESNEED